MAEPLLKRTFSRLRGKEKFRRKTDPKLGDIPGKADFLQSSLSSSSASAVQSEPPLAAEDNIKRGTQITVAKKQNWAKLSSSSSSSFSSSRDPPSAEGPHSLGSWSLDWESCSGKAQASKQAWSQKTLSEEAPEMRRKDFEREPGLCAPLYDTSGTALPKLTHPPGGYGEICIPASGEKLSGQGAYLQTLDRSSRAWVLSTGKSQATEEASRTLPNCLTEWRQGGSDRESNIWYNPIPEEEDLRGLAGGLGGRSDSGDPWRKREIEGSPESKRDPQTRTQRWAGLLGNSGFRSGSDRHGASGVPSAPTCSGTGSDGHAKELTTECAAAARKDNPDLPQQAVQVDPQQAGAVAGPLGAVAGA
ncbi:hypothetical protein AGOR_G00197540 [Albula goreensis]|uniref:Uncharacterized protein n=1 Tax=Albula goreensis TaxID=1534307 RepID=A0A8T3CQC3_9TELE|nr:hypothetical protein AGOR_G00197540 [Albula goreensis]